MRKVLASCALAVMSTGAFAAIPNTPLGTSVTSFVTSQPGVAFSDTAVVTAYLEGVYEVYMTPQNYDIRRCITHGPAGCRAPTASFRTSIDSITIFDAAGAVVPTMASVATPVGARSSFVGAWYPTTSYHITVYLKPGSYSFVQTGMASGISPANPTGPVSGQYTFLVRTPANVPCQGTSTVASTMPGRAIQLANGAWVGYWYATVMQAQSFVIGYGATASTVSQAPYLIPGTSLVGLNVDYVGVINANSSYLTCAPSSLSFY